MGKVQEISPQIPICFTHFNIKLTQVKTPILNDFTPLTPSATKVPNFTTNDSPSIYAALQTFYTFYIKITLFPFLDYDTCSTPSPLWQKKKGTVFQPFPLQ